MAFNNDFNLTQYISCHSKCTSINPEFMTLFVSESVSSSTVDPRSAVNSSEEQENSLLKILTMGERSLIAAPSVINPSIDNSISLVDIVAIVSNFVLIITYVSKNGLYWGEVTRRIE
jgi:hypothetical protein